MTISSPFQLEIFYDSLIAQIWCVFVSFFEEEKEGKPGTSGQIHWDMESGSRKEGWEVREDP